MSKAATADRSNLALGIAFADQGEGKGQWSAFADRWKSSIVRICGRESIMPRGKDEWMIDRSLDAFVTKHERVPTLTELSKGEYGIDGAKKDKLSKDTARLALLRLQARQANEAGNREAERDAEHKLIALREHIKRLAVKRAKKSINKQDLEIRQMLAQAYKYGEEGLRVELGKDRNQKATPLQVVESMMTNLKIKAFYESEIKKGSNFALYGCPNGHPQMRTWDSADLNEEAPNFYSMCIFCSTPLRRIAPTPAPLECAEDPTPIEIAIAETRR